VHPHVHPRRDLALRPRPHRDAGRHHRLIALVVAIFLAVFVLPTGWGIAAIVAGILIEVSEAGFWIRFSRRWRPRVGAEALIGAEGVALTECRPEGQVRIRGERWTAICAEGADAGDGIVVEGLADLKLLVRRRV
jgi:membrane protein implicated in regulation of membrane protease activity